MAACRRMATEEAMRGMDGISCAALDEYDCG
jgi:hypothetical protein